MARSEAQGNRRRETGRVHVGGNWEEEGLMGRKTGNLVASTNCSTRRSSIHKLESCYFFALEFCLEDHFPLSLTSYTLFDLCYLSPWSSYHQKPFKQALNISVDFSALHFYKYWLYYCPLLPLIFFFFEGGRNLFVNSLCLIFAWIFESNNCFSQNENNSAFVPVASLEFWKKSFCSNTIHKWLPQNSEQFLTVKKYQ